MASLTVEHCPDFPQMLFWLLLLYIVEISIPVYFFVCFFLFVCFFGGEKLTASLDYIVRSRDQNSKYDVFYSSLCTFSLSL